MTKLVAGHGFNDGKYPVQVVVDGEKVPCPYYTRWANMLERCYSTAYHANKPTYKGCSVSKEWLVYSVFRSWMEGQDWEGKYLDKDILSDNGSVYSKDVCVFISNKANTFLNKTTKPTGDFLVGVHISGERFQSSIWIDGKAKHLGVFDREIDAHNEWRFAKADEINVVADNESDKRVKLALYKLAFKLSERIMI